MELGSRDQELRNPLGLPADCFSLCPGARLRATRNYLTSLDGSSLKSLMQRVSKYAYPHCAYAIPAWCLTVLPGPGEESDPYDPYRDWTPGLGETSRHFSEFPDYLVETAPQELLQRVRLDRGGKMWPKLRSTLRAMNLPGVSPEDHFACWGLVNLTTEHAPSEASRSKSTPWNVGPLKQIIELCRPAMIIAPPGSRCFQQVQKSLAEKGYTISGQVLRYSGDKGGRTWDFTCWKTPWGKVRVGKMHTPILVGPYGGRYPFKRGGINFKRVKSSGLLRKILRFVNTIRFRIRWWASFSISVPALFQTADWYRNLV